MNQSIHTITLAILLLVFPMLASAQLVVTVLPPKVVGQKAMVPLAFTNGLSEKIESARALALVTDEGGKVLGQTTQWVIGGRNDKPGLAAGGTNHFYCVITSDKPFKTTNLTAKVVFSRIILEGGKPADVDKTVKVNPARP